MSAPAKFFAGRAARGAGGRLPRHAPSGRRRWIVLAAVPFLLATAGLSPGAEKVEFVADSVEDESGGVLKLRGGSEWRLGGEAPARRGDGVIIIYGPEADGTGGRRAAVAYIRGREVEAHRVSGAVEVQPGYLSEVVGAVADCGTLQLTDGTVVAIVNYGDDASGWWLPPYKVLITDNESYITHLKSGRRMWFNKE
jgi:hypothetical protein